jgi:hypothetical protein
MKKNNIVYGVFLFLFMLVCVSKSIYSGGHDSLLYDGATAPTDITEDCYVRVIYTKGTTSGTYHVTKTYQICGKTETSKETETGKLSPMNELKLGEEISTGDDGALEMQFFDGSRLRMGPNSKITITGNMCESQTLVHMAGKVWTKVKKLLGSQKYEIKTMNYWAGVRGTEFSVETNGSEVITRVFEGSVEIKSTASAESKDTESSAKDMQKLTEDFQAGKITMDEYMKKAQEFQSKMNKVGEDVGGKMCEAGYMITVSGNVGDPVPVEKSSSNWFDDENFK